MPKYPFFTGQYPYPLVNVLTDGGADNEPFYDGDPLTAIPDTPNWYVFCATPDEILAIRSSIEVGAPIAYPDSYNPIVNIIEQAFQFPNQIPEGSCMEICQLIIDCIMDTPELRDLISSVALSGVTAQLTDAINENIAGSDISDGQSEDCNNDNLFGMTTGLVDLINNLAVDLSEQITASTNQAARLGDGIEAIPVVGILPLDDALQFSESFLGDIAENYDASYTELVRDQFRCDLFCIAQANDCLLTFGMIFDYFNGLLAESLITIDLEDLLESLTQGVFSGVELVYGWHAFVSGMMLFGTSILNIDAIKMAKIVGALWNDPDSDWEIICDCPDSWSFDSDFHEDENIWNVTNLGFGDLAEWVEDEGYIYTDASTGGGSYSRIIRIETDEFTPTEIGNISFNFDITKGISTSTATALAIVATKDNDSLIQQTQTFTATSNGTNKTFSCDVDEPDIKKILILLRCWTGTTTAYAGDIVLNSVHVDGEGDNPFE